MEKVIQSIIRIIPKNLNGSCLVKSTEIFIPYKEVGIECLTREVTEINLFFESILKFIEMGVQDIDEIAQILGVGYNIVKEVVVDMIDQKYLVTTENRIIMTPKGRRALETRKLVTIQKHFINQVLVNLITGEIISGDGISTSKVQKNDICLNEEVRVDREYLENHHSTINDIYQKYQVDDNVFGNQSITRELYKILDLAYERLVYIKNQLYIYMGTDTEEYQFAFNKDMSEQYINCFYRQVKDIVPPSLDNFFERDYSFVNSHKSRNPIDDKLFEKTLCLSKVLSECGDRVDENLLEQFQKRRYMLIDNEYRNYILHNSDFSWEKLIIVSGRLKKIFDNSIWNEIKNISRNKEIYIIFDGSEYGIENDLSKLKANSIKKHNIILIKKRNLNQNKIYFYPSVAIDIFEEVYEMFKRPATLKKGIVEFEQKTVDELTVQIENNYNVIFQSEKQEENEIREKRNGKKLNRNSGRRYKKEQKNLS